jgi:hypothetical protein
VIRLRKLLKYFQRDIPHKWDKHISFGPRKMLKLGFKSQVQARRGHLDEVMPCMNRE